MATSTEMQRKDACPACDAGDLGALTRVRDHEYAVDWEATYATCGRCRTSFQHPMPDDTQLASFYPSDYHSFGRRGLLTQIRYDMRVKRLRALAGSDGAIVDYGCGDGSFLVRAASQMPGRKFFGYEIGDKKEVEVLADGAVTLVRGSFDDLLGVLPECRLVTMNHVIEHLRDPFHVVSALRERMLPGGTLEGQTPASASLEQKVFGAKWSGYHAPRHTVVFSRDGLRRLLERAGFADVAVTSAFNPAGIAVSLASMGHSTDGGRIKRAGPVWLFWLGLAVGLAPIDLLSGASGIINFQARKGAPS